MGIQLTKVGLSFNMPIEEYICDTEADLNSIPKKTCGSTAFIIETNKRYILNTDKEWKEKK